MFIFNKLENKKICPLLLSLHPETTHHANILEGIIAASTSAHEI